MLPEIHAISRNRRRLGLTQSELAKAAGVSQSLVAKIEAGRLDPSYSNAKALLDALEAAGRGEEKRAKDVMHHPIISAKSGEMLSQAVGLMRRHGFSQLPVEDEHGKIVGSLSEKSLLEKMEAGKVDSKAAKVADVMDEAFPSVSESTPVSAIVSLLHDAQAVLVLRKDKIAGVVTKSDLLKAL
ncbi:MAG: CBS domain-containing protein [Candidatus Micrarchaeota archaeon]